MNTSKTNQEREKALNRIRKMFALANDKGASEGEIENALKFAQSLMAKYNIERDEVDLSPDDIDIEIQDNDFTNLERKYWFWDLLCVIGKSYDCDVLKSTKGNKVFYKIVGTREDRTLTKELFNLTVPLVRSMAKVRYEERVKKAQENLIEAILNPLPTKRFFTASYIDGFISGLSQKLSQQKNEIKIEDESGKYALMVIKKDELIQGWIKNSMGKLKSAKSTNATSVDGAAYNEGFKDGKDNGQKKLC